MLLTSWTPWKTLGTTLWEMLSYRVKPKLLGVAQTVPYDLPCPSVIHCMPTQVHALPGKGGSPGGRDLPLEPKPSCPAAHILQEQEAKWPCFWLQTPGPLLELLTLNKRFDLGASLALAFLSGEFLYIPQSPAQLSPPLWSLPVYTHRTSYKPHSLTLMHCRGSRGLINNSESQAETWTWFLKSFGFKTCLEWTGGYL